jgi:membrane protease YdiL (CAAX protease family)
MPDPRTTPPSIRLSPAALLALLLFGTLALLFHAYLRIRLQNAGVVAGHAYNLSYLVVPPIALAPLPLILRGQAGVFRHLFDPRRISLRLAIGAVALGILLRIIFWAMLVVRAAFGLGPDSSTAVSIGPAFTFDCPPLQILGVGLLVMAVLVPLTEEIIHRGVVQSAFVRRGPFVAIGLSTLLFAVFHQASGYVFVFLTGIVLGILLWRTQTLWATLITHGTYNGLIQFDWICLNSRWQPASQDLPLLQAGTIALVVGLGACAGIMALLWRCGRGA